MCRGRNEGRRRGGMGGGDEHQPMSPGHPQLLILFPGAPAFSEVSPGGSVARPPWRPLESPSVARWGPTALLSL